MDTWRLAAYRSSMWTVLLTETMHDAGLALLRARQDVRLLIAAPGTAAFDGAIAEAGGIGVRTSYLPATVLARAVRLRVVAKHGVGYDNVDVAHLSARRIPMTIAAGANASSVAEHTLMLMLAAAKHLRRYDAAVRNGPWSERLSTRAVDLNGRTVLVVGFGRVGSRVAALCRAFGMHVLVHDIRPLPLASSYEVAPSLDAALARADVLTLHVPLDASTRCLIASERLARLPRGAVVVNCARGGVVDEAALAQALESGHLAAAAVDVFAQEPPDPTNRLLALPNVVVTPHSAATTAEGARKMAEAVATNILATFDGRLDPAMVVNVTTLMPPCPPLEVAPPSGGEPGSTQA